MNKNIDGCEKEKNVEPLKNGIENDYNETVTQSEQKVKGRALGFFGMLYMAGYLLYIHSVFSGAKVNNLGSAIGMAAAINLFGPFFYSILAAVLFSLVGVLGKKQLCILFALAATIGAIFILPSAFKMLIIPAVLFLFSYVRMAN